MSRSKTKKPIKQPPEGERDLANPLDELFAQIFRDAQQPPDDRPEWIKELDKKLRVFKDDPDEWKYLVAYIKEADDKAQKERTQQLLKFLEARYPDCFPAPAPAEIIDLAAYRKNMSK